MQKTERTSIPIKVIALILDIVIYIYYLLNIYWMFEVIDMGTHPLTHIFIRINPMTIGVYVSGIAMLIHLVAYRNVFSRCVMCLPFLLSATASMISFMGMTGWNDLIIFIPDVIIFCLAVIIVIKQSAKYSKVIDH